MSSGGFLLSGNLHFGVIMLDVVCGVIENEAGEFLACLRPPGKHLGGLWEFPGGKVESGESAEFALARELHEELGVEVEVGPGLGPVIWTYAEQTIRLLPFRCRILSGTVKAIEHEDLCWCLPGNFGNLSWADADVPVLQQILALETQN